jgi:hypothetical protein
VSINHFDKSSKSSRSILETGLLIASLPAPGCDLRRCGCGLQFISAPGLGSFSSPLFMAITEFSLCVSGPCMQAVSLCVSGPCMRIWPLHASCQPLRIWPLHASCQALFKHVFDSVERPDRSVPAVAWKRSFIRHRILSPVATAMFGRNSDRIVNIGSTWFVSARFPLSINRSSVAWGYRMMKRQPSVNH